MSINTEQSLPKPKRRLTEAEAPPPPKKASELWRPRENEIVLAGIWCTPTRAGRNITLEDVLHSGWPER